jgi:glutamate racemase
MQDAAVWKMKGQNLTDESKLNLHTDAPIAVYDSGLGGLTVVRAIMRLMPGESIVYFGDTARVPYGNKSARTVGLFAQQCLRFLGRLNPKLIVVACNTVSATAMPLLLREFQIPLIGVLEPGATAAVRIARHRIPTGDCTIGLIATEATVASRAYQMAIGQIDRQVNVAARACPLLVPLIEEGRGGDSPVVKMVLEEYVEPLRQISPAALIMGCTHYPLFSDAIAAAISPDTMLVDSAAETAEVVRARLKSLGLLRADSFGKLACYVTDQGQRFEAIASRFLGKPVGQPVWVDPEIIETSTVESA